jgi:regulator of replication initiation timing
VLWQPNLDPRSVAGLASTRTYPLRSSFRPSYNMAVNLVGQFGRHTARELLESSFAQFQADRAVVGMARQVRKQEEALDGYHASMSCHLGDFEEYARLRRELSDLHRKLDERQASQPPASAHPAETTPPAEDPRVAALKERVSTLRSELSQRHAERNQLRRQLERTSERVDALEAERASVARPPAEEDADDDDRDAESDDPAVALSFRVPVFSKRFRSSASAAPDAVRRRAVILASRIAAGDEAAFRGTRRLRLDRDLYRQRVGREHRLIFRMHALELEAVDLVPRKDLERTIRELSHG